MGAGNIGHFYAGVRNGLVRKLAVNKRVHTSSNEHCLSTRTPIYLPFLARKNPDPCIVRYFSAILRGLVVNVNGAPFSWRNTALAHSARHDLADLMVRRTRVLRVVL